MSFMYLKMAEALAMYWRKNKGVYPKKFVLTQVQFLDYDQSRRLFGGPSGGSYHHTHMGVPIEISSSTPGVMVAADGTEIMLR